MISSGKIVYPAFVKEDEEGMFCVFFPNLFSEFGWEYPMSRGKTKQIAIKKAEKELAYSLAGFLYDNESLPKPFMIQNKHIPQGMELINIETSLEAYAEEIKEKLKGRHWHINYYVEESEECLEAIGFKNKGMWDIYYSDNDGEEFLFTVKLYSEAEEKFKQFVEDVVLKRR